ncbi:peptidoglycan hydrolase CwlO-like protein [Clostridiales Family XIII bacterium PM5-7]
MKRKLISVTCAVMLILAFSTTVFATETERLKQAPDLYTQEHKEEIKELQEAVESNQKEIETRVGGTKRLSVPLYK